MAVVGQTAEVDADLHQSTWDHEILSADTSSKGKQLLMRPLLRKTTSTDMASS
jgi:hypothetical protein